MTDGLPSVDKLLVMREATNNHCTSSNFTRDAYTREDIAEIPDNKLEAIPTDLLQGSQTDADIEEILQGHIFGNPRLKERVSSLLHRYRHCFRTSVSNTPAQVLPFHLDINLEEWHQPKNRLAPRRCDKTREKELLKQLDILLRNEVIQVSQAPYYSHGFVVPKAGGKWRFVVDYKNLNKITTSERWPLPNIKEMIHRIGEH